MKKKDLEEKLNELESKYSLHKINHTEMFNLQYESNKIFINIINDFNEKTETYSRYLLFFTVIIAVLTTIMALPILKQIFSWVLKIVQKNNIY